MFRSLFGRAQASEPTADEGGHFVTLRPRISALLDQAANSHTLMSASLKGLDHPIRATPPFSKSARAKATCCWTS